MWRKIEEYSKEHDGHVAVMILYGSQVPVFPVLEDDVNADAILICKPKFVEQVRRELDIHSRPLNGKVK